MTRRQRFAQRWMFFWNDSWWDPNVVDRFGEREWLYTPEWWDHLPCRLIPGSHLAISDQCGIPTHDYCAWCARGMPGMAERLQPLTH